MPPGSGAPSQAIHLIVPSGLKLPASRRRSNRTSTPSYPRATASPKSRRLSIATRTCNSVFGSNPRQASRKGTEGNHHRDTEDTKLRKDREIGASDLGNPLDGLSALGGGEFHHEAQRVRNRFTSHQTLCSLW